MIIPAWKSIEMLEMLKMLTDMPLLLPCDQNLMVPPRAYTYHQDKVEFQAWQESKLWWEKTPIKMVMCGRLCGKASNSKVFAKSLAVRFASHRRFEDLYISIRNHRAA